MKKYLKWLGIFFCLNLILFGSYPAEAEETTTLTLRLSQADREYMVGDTISIDVMLSGNPGALSKLTAVLDYDKEVLEYQGINFRTGIFNTWDTKMWNKNQILMSTNSVSQYSSANGLVCTISMKALQATNETTVNPVSISMNSGTASMQGYSFGASGLKFGIAEYSASEIPVRTVTLSKDILMLGEGGSARLLAVTEPDNTTDPTVTWSSSNKTVATVDQRGMVLALSEGTAQITAKAGNISAVCTVIVQSDVPDERKGFLLDLNPAATNAAADTTVPVSLFITAGTEDAQILTDYNAADITFQYDTQRLSFDGIAQDQSYVVTEDKGAGTLRLQRIGEKTALGQAAVLNFRTVAGASGTAKISVLSAYIDQSEHASMQDAPPAVIRGRNAVIQIGKEYAVYKVWLPSGYESGNQNTASPTADYTFSITKDRHYDYSVTATIDGKTIQLTDPKSDGTYVISSGRITGDITIQLTKTPKKYAVTVLGNASSDLEMTDGKEVEYGNGYSFRIVCEEGYNYTVVMTSDGTRISGITPSKVDNTLVYTIPASKIKGGITVNVTKIKATNTQTENTPGTDETSGNGTESDNNTGKETESDPTGKPTDQNHHTPETQGNTNNRNPSTNGGTTTYTGNTGNRTSGSAVNHTYSSTANTQTGRGETNVTDGKMPWTDLELVTYVKLDGKNVYLLTLKGYPGESRNYMYDLVPMYYSDKYGAFCHLIISELSAEQLLEKAKPLISIGEGTISQISYTGDVDGNGVIDREDVQKICDIYNAEYDDFSIDATMLAFLSADLAGDKSSDKCLDISDALAVTAPAQYDPIEALSYREETEATYETETEAE